MGNWRAILRGLGTRWGAPRQERTPFVPSADLSPEEVLALHRLIIDVLRVSDGSPGLAAHIDCISDRPWPVDVRQAVDHIRRLGGASDATAVSVNLNDPADREAFLTLTPYTINAEVWSQNGELVFTASDTGTATYAELTAAEARALHDQLDSHGLAGSLISPEKGHN